MINVGGEKVFPAEVESVIQELENVAEVTVYSEMNPILGNIVCAKIRLSTPENQKDFKLRMKLYCKEKLQPFKIPVKVLFEEGKLYNDRYKKNRVI